MWQNNNDDPKPFNIEPNLEPPDNGDPEPEKVACEDCGEMFTYDDLHHEKETGLYFCDGPDSNGCWDNHVEQEGDMDDPVDSWRMGHS